MFRNLFTSLTILGILKLVRSDTSQEHQPDGSPKYTVKFNLDNVSTDSWDINPNSIMNSLWMHRPSTYLSLKEKENELHPAYLKGPFSVTRLAKPLAFGVDPYFQKGYFEPFEKRQRAVTLVAFRRNGLLPRSSVKFEESHPAEVAEMQSPYNQVSSFWDNEPGLINE